LSPHDFFGGTNTTVEKCGRRSASPVDASARSSPLLCVDDDGNVYAWTSSVDGFTSTGSANCVPSGSILMTAEN